MKRVLLLFVLLFAAFNLYASNNYTIAIVPFIKSSQLQETYSESETIEKTNIISDSQVSDLNLKATESVADIFNKYIIPLAELNKNQKINYLVEMQNKKIKLAKQTLSNYYKEKASSNYTTFDSKKYEKNIESAKKLIDDETIKLSNFIYENKNSDKFVNTLGYEIPTNVQSNSTNKIEIKVINNYLDCFMLSNYTKQYRNYFLEKNDVNEIIFVEVDKLSTFNNFKIYFEDLQLLQNGTFDNYLNLIFDRLIENDSISSLEQYILKALINYSYPNLSIIKNEIENKNITIKQIVSNRILDKINEIEWDDETQYFNNSVIYIDTDEIYSYDCAEISNHSSFILIDEGVHYFLITGANIYPYVLKVVSSSDEITSISVGGNIKQNGFLQLNSNIGKVHWIIDGKNIAYKNSLELDNQVIPSTVLIKKDNFSNKLLEINEVSSKFNVDLNPPWMEESLVFEKKQSDFYQGLLNYIIGCATFISIKTINNIYGKDTYKDIINNLNDGVLILAQVDIVYQLVSYIKLATN